MTKGILLAAWGKRGYIYAAYNLAFSIKHFNRRLPVYLYCDPQLLKELLPDQQDVFDEIIEIPFGLLSQSPAEIKISCYDILPFDNTLFLDVDALCLKDLEPCIDEMMASEEYYFTHILDTHTLDKGDNIPNMVWATANKIWEKYNLPPDAVLPCSNSSFQFFKKCDQTTRLIAQIKKNIADPIPLKELKTQWGGSQPDELYLNIAMAQLGITGKSKREYLFMGYALSPLPLHMIAEKYFILSIFGGKHFTKPRYTEWYDKLIINYHYAHAKGFVFKYKDIARDKHANTRPVRFDSVSGFDKAKEVSSNDKFIHGNSGETVILYSGWYKATTPERQEEINQCLLNNLNNKEISWVVLVGEDHCEIKHKKLIVHKTSSRPTYDDFIAAANSSADENTISIICNGDIYLDESNVKKIRGINFTDTALALSRWEQDVNGRAKLFNYEWSQDTWVVRGKFKALSCPIHLGTMQCDNRIAFELQSAGYKVFNPSMDIQTFHVHKTGIRTYDVHAGHEGGKLAVKPRKANDILKKRLLINQPGKTGDILICAPIADYYSAEYFVDWFCPKEYHELFNYLPYANPVLSYNEKEYDKIIDLSFGLGGKPEKWWRENRHRFDSFVTAKYELAGLPIQLKKELRWVRNQKRENELYDLIIIKGESYALVHNKSDYGTPIEPNTGSEEIIYFRPIKDYSIFDWYKVILNASEIHCIDSSLCNFVDSIPASAFIKKFYYKSDRVPNQWDETLLSLNWQRVNLLEKVA